MAGSTQRERGWQSGKGGMTTRVDFMERSGKLEPTIARTYLKSPSAAVYICRNSALIPRSSHSCSCKGECHRAIVNRKEEEEAAVQRRTVLGRLPCLRVLLSRESDGFQTHPAPSGLLRPLPSASLVPSSAPEAFLSLSRVRQMS